MINKDRSPSDAYPILANPNQPTTRLFLKMVGRMKKRRPVMMIRDREADYSWKWWREWKICLGWWWWFERPIIRENDENEKEMARMIRMIIRDRETDYSWKWWREWKRNGQGDDDSRSRDRELFVKMVERMKNMSRMMMIREANYSWRWWEWKRDGYYDDD